jgi:hypothetical protein
MRPPHEASAHRRWALLLPPLLPDLREAGGDGEDCIANLHARVRST